MQTNFPFKYQTFKSDGFEISFLSEGGPRIVGLTLNGSENILAEVPEKIEETPYGTYHFVGGHRLWASPEEKPLTYLPDDTGLQIVEHANGFDLIGAPNVINGLQKQIQVLVDSSKNQVSLSHLLRNTGTNPIDCAAWSITELRPGGKAVFPMGTLILNPDNLLPDRHLSLWPYSRWDDSRVQYKADHLFVDMTIIDQHPGKWGSFNARGWMAYWLEGILFCKKAVNISIGKYPDYGCNAEMYLCDQFIELESLGPLQQILPGAEIMLNETWTIQQSPEITCVDRLSDKMFC